jgi:chaperonin cofactor prefoldin
MNNGKKEDDDLDTKVKITFGTIENYFDRINKKYSSLIKKDEDLNRKFKKLKQIIKDYVNS